MNKHSLHMSGNSIGLARQYFRQFPDVPLSLNTFKSAWTTLLSSPVLDYIDLTLCLQRVAGRINYLPIKAQESFSYFLKSPQGLDAWLEKSENHLHHFDPQALARSIWGFQEMGVCPTQTFLKKWNDITLTKADDFSPEDVKNSLCSFVNLGLHPGNEVLNRLVDVAESKMQYFKCNDFASYAWAIGHLATRLPASTLKTLTDRAEHLHHDMSPKHLRNYVSGLTMLSAVSDSQPELYHLKVFTKSLIKSGDDKRNINIVNKAARLFQLEDLYQDIRGFEPEGSRWTRNLRYEFSQVSGVTTLEPSYDYTMQTNTNIAFEYKGEKFVIKADGPSRYLQDFDGNLVLDGQGELQSLFVQQQFPGAHILRLAYIHEERMLEDYETDLPALLDKFSGAAPCIYHSDIEDGHFTVRPNVTGPFPH